MTKHWTEAARAAAAERARRTQPWTCSTGPKTDIGKLVSRMNALKHGMRSRIRAEPYRIIKERLRAIERYIRAVRLYVRFRNQALRKKILTNELS
jgi:signal transduction histidine kinase